MNLQDVSPVFVAVVNSLLLAALPAAAVALVVILAGWAKQVWASLKASQPTLAELLEQYARIAVEAAEQAGVKKLIADKKTYAVAVTQAWLAEVGFGAVNVELIAAEVERQVGAMKQGY
jgi:hypothetical protein